MKMVRCLECTWLRKELRLDNIGFVNAHRLLIVASQWNLRIAYVIYRILLALFLSAWMTFSVVTFGSSTHSQCKWFIYIGNWAFIVFVAYALLAAIITIYYEAVNRKGEEYEMEAGKSRMMEQFLSDVSFRSLDAPTSELSRNNRAYSTESLEPIIPEDEETANIFQIFCWILYNVASTITVISSVAYWTFVYDGSQITAAMIQTYVINVVLVVIDLWVSYTTIRIAHAWMGMAFCGLYVVFSCVYWILGGTNLTGNHFIYHEFDFRDFPGEAAIYVCGVILFFIPAVQCLMYAMYRFRLVVRKRTLMNQN